MSNVLDRYKTDITDIFGIGVTILHSARALKSISLDLKLLAINGIVQAAKIGSSQGQSLITLSGFLSDLPVQIAPELEELEEMSGGLARELTICSISVRRFVQYSLALEKSLAAVFKEQKSRKSVNDFDLLNIAGLSSLQYLDEIEATGSMHKFFIPRLAEKNISAIEVINQQLMHAHRTIMQANNRIDNIKRNGFIANYMGSNILIESSYLSSDQRSFQSLVNNIKGIVDILDNNLEMISENIAKGDMMLRRLVNLR